MVRKETKRFLDEFGSRSELMNFRSVAEIQKIKGISDVYFYRSDLTDIFNDLFENGLATRKLKGESKGGIILYNNPSDYHKDGAINGVWVYKLIVVEENW